MNENKGRNIFWGLILIAVALLVLVTKMGYFADIPFLKIGISVVFAAAGIKSLFSKEFVGFFACAGIIGCIFNQELGIQSITPWVLMFACILIGIGFDLIFKKQTQYIGPKYSDQTDSNHTSSYDWNNFVSAENVFNSQTRYIKNQNLQRANLRNEFGKLVVYFQEADLDPNGAYVKVDNGFGETDLYIPKIWHINMKQNNGLGKITIYGECSQEPNAPVLNLDIDNGLGAVQINLV